MGAIKESAEVTRNGVGVELLSRYYIFEESRYAFSDSERDTLRRVSRRFREKLQATGFIPAPRAGEEVDRI